MTILVTTPTGKVGSNVVKNLLERGIAVRVGAHTVSKAQAAFPNAEVVPFDFEDAASVEAAVKGVSAIYLASNGESNAEVVIRAIDLAKAAGVKRIVHLGAKGAELADTPLRQREEHLKASGLEWTLLRPGWFMQNYVTMHLQSIQNGVIAEPAGDGKTAFIDSRDIAAVAVAALTEDGHHGKAYALTGGEALDRYQVADLISKATGLSVQYQPLSDEVFRDNVKAYLPADYLEFLIGLYGVIRAGYTADTTNDVQQVLGRAPIKFEQFAQDYRENWIAETVS